VLATVHVAEISLIVSGLAAAASIAAVWLTYRLGVRRFEHERRLSDIDNSRHVLDDAAAGMIRAESWLATVRSHLGDYAQTQPGNVRAESPIVADSAALEDARDNLDALTARLLIRFGSGHELVKVYKSIALATLEIAYRVKLISEAYDAGAEVKSEEKPIEDAVRQFSLARESFALIAYRIVGVDLKSFQLAEKEKQVSRHWAQKD
jgi:hypothetical protein